MRHVRGKMPHPVKQDRIDNYRCERPFSWIGRVSVGPRVPTIGCDDPAEPLTELGRPAILLFDDADDMLAIEDKQQSTNETVARRHGDRLTTEG